VRAEVVAVGDELLAGDIVNANAAWLGAQLAARGISVSRGVVVGDRVGEIAAAIREGLARADAVVLTGGLGPTSDDLTREGLAAAAGVRLVRDGHLEAVLTRRPGRSGRPVPGNNLRQADLPEGARALPNPVGTAPGIALEIGSGLVVALPGPPHELAAVFADSAGPLLARRAGSDSVLVTRVLRTVGMWESAVSEALAPEVDRVAAAGNPVIAFLASEGQTRVRITARATGRAAAEALIAPVEAAARAALSRHLYGVDDDTLEAVTLRLLSAAGATLACAESLTGGLLSARLTSVPGASAVVLGGVVAYATAAKSAQLGVPPDVLARDGAVSATAARAMASGVRERFGATYGLALTGVAGPGEQEGRPPGTVHVAMVGPGVARDVALLLPGDRERVRTYAAVAAVDLLRRTLVPDVRTPER
jgi:nicotinamide-nucleotide amidase